SSAADCETDGYLSSSGFLDSPDLAHRSFVAVDPTSPRPTRPVRCFPTSIAVQLPTERLPPASGFSSSVDSYTSDVASGMSDGCEGLSASEQSTKLPPKRASGKLLRRRARSRLRITNISDKSDRVVECQLQTYNNKMVTFKFDLDGDNPEEIAAAMVHNEFILKSERDSFISRIRDIIHRVETLLRKDGRSGAELPKGPEAESAVGSPVDLQLQGLSRSISSSSSLSDLSCTSPSLSVQSPVLPLLSRSPSETNLASPVEPPAAPTPLGSPTGTSAGRMGMFTALVLPAARWLEALGCLGRGLRWPLGATPDASLSAGSAQTWPLVSMTPSWLTSSPALPLSPPRTPGGPVPPALPQALLSPQPLPTSPVPCEPSSPLSPPVTSTPLSPTAPLLSLANVFSLAVMTVAHTVSSIASSGGHLYPSLLEPTGSPLQLLSTSTPGSPEGSTVLPGAPKPSHSLIISEAPAPSVPKAQLSPISEETKPQVLGRFQVMPAKDLAVTSPVLGSSDGEQHSTEPAARGSPPPVVPDTGHSSSSDSDVVLEAAEQDPKAEEVSAEGGTVPVAPVGSDREGPGEESTENVPQAMLSQVWLSYSRSLSYVSSDDTESEDEEIWEELQNLRQKHLAEVQLLQSAQKKEIEELYLRMGKQPPPGIVSPAAMLSSRQRRLSKGSFNPSRRNSLQRLELAQPAGIMRRNSLSGSSTGSQEQRLNKGVTFADDL
ncbi:WNK4 kinase, partial [Myiagra hebetior]|nr:WNK4 kinase [Myiagra hebetior]